MSFASCVGLVLALSLTSNSGIFYAYVIEEFNVELTTLTFIGSISTTISFTVNSFSFLWNSKFRHIKRVQMLVILKVFLNFFIFFYHMSKFFFNCWYACIFFTCQWLNVGSFICQVSVVILLESYKYIQSPLSWKQISLYYR